MSSIPPIILDNEDENNKQCYCNITHQKFTDPVVAEDGFTYERSAISEWLCSKNQSPMTREPMGNRLVPNQWMRQFLGLPLKVLKEQHKDTEEASEEESEEEENQVSYVFINRYKPPEPSICKLSSCVTIL